MPAEEETDAAPRQKSRQKGECEICVRALTLASDAERLSSGRTYLCGRARRVLATSAPARLLLLVVRALLCHEWRNGVRFECHCQG